MNIEKFIKKVTARYFPTKSDISPLWDVFNT